MWHACVRLRAGGWFSLCLAFINAAVMLLWFWGSSRKQRFFDAMTLPVDSFLRLGGAGDTQASMTVAQQRATVTRTGASIKRARGALVAFDACKIAWRSSMQPPGDVMPACVP